MLVGTLVRVSNQPLPLPDSASVSQEMSRWQTVVHNDPVNLMLYVEWVFESYFRFTPDKARRLMLQVHNEGRAVVSQGQREQMEADAQAMHGYGLWATIEEVH